MADSYILNVRPTISASDGRKLETDLNNRFARVAKKFGGALRTVGSSLRGILAGGAIAGIGAILTNPIEKLNASMNEALNKADNIATRAGQIETTAGKMMMLQAVAESAGVQNFDMIISRFQSELGRARAGENDVLREFTGEKDTLDAFVKVIDSIKALSPSEQSYMISKIFGERANLQLAEFLQTDLSQRKRAIFGDTTSEELTRAVNRLAEREELQAVLGQRRGVQDLLSKSRVITDESVRLQNEIASKQLEAENISFSNYEMFAKMQVATEDSKVILADIQAKMTPLIEKSVGLLEKLYNWLITSKLGKWAGGVFK